MDRKCLFIICLSLIDKGVGDSIVVHVLNLLLIDDVFVDLILTNQVAQNFPIHRLVSLGKEYLKLTGLGPVGILHDHTNEIVFLMESRPFVLIHSDIILCL